MNLICIEFKETTEYDMEIGKLVIYHPWSGLLESALWIFCGQRRISYYFQGSVLANSYHYMDTLKSDEFPSINTVLGVIEFHDRSSKDGLKIIINSVQAPVLKSIYDHQEIQSVTSEIC